MTHAFSVVIAKRGQAVATIESKMFLRKTGLDLTNVKTLAAIIAASAGRLRWNTSLG